MLPCRLREFPQNVRTSVKHEIRSSKLSFCTSKVRNSKPCHTWVSGFLPYVLILSRGRMPERRTQALPHAPMPPQGIFTRTQNLSETRTEKLETVILHLKVQNPKSCQCLRDCSLL